VRRKHAALTAEIARGRHKTDEWRRRKARDGRATANNVMRSFRACWNRALRQNPDHGNRVDRAAGLVDPFALYRPEEDVSHRNEVV